MKVKEIAQINSAIKMLLDDTKVSFGTKLKFQFLTIMKQLEPIVTNITTLRDEKIREYGTEDENGEISIKKSDTETVAKFQNDMEELFNTDVDLVVTKINAEDIFQYKIPADYLLALYSIIEEE